MARTLHVFEGEHLLEGGALRLDGHDLAVQFFVADKAVLRLAVVEDVLVVLLRHRGINGDVDGAGLHDGMVHDVPFAPVVVADQGHLFLGLKAHGNEPARHRVHFIHKLGSGVGHAVAVVGHGHHHVQRLGGQLVTREVEQAGGLGHGSKVEAPSASLGSKIHTHPRTASRQAWCASTGRDHSACRTTRRRRGPLRHIQGKPACSCQPVLSGPIRHPQCLWGPR